MLQPGPLYNAQELELMFDALSPQRGLNRTCFATFGPATVGICPRMPDRTHVREPDAARATAEAETSHSLERDALGRIER